MQAGRVTERTYKLDELARATGMSTRTVRYYVQRGLLPPAAFRGKDTSYGHEHHVRLRAIRRLQEAFFPLDAIAAELASRTLGEVEAIADGKAMPVSVAPAAAEERGPAVRDGAPAPEEDPRVAIERQASRVFRRIELFPGVDLTVADDAPEKSVRLVSEMLTILEAMSKVKEGGRKR
jgi:Ca-activated chloride channel family protein